MKLNIIIIDHNTGGDFTVFTISQNYEKVLNRGKCLPLLCRLSQDSVLIFCESCSSFISNSLALILSSVALSLLSGEGGLADPELAAAALRRLA